MTATGVVARGRATRADAGTWRVMAGQECRDLWVTGRGPSLLFEFTVLLSAVTYLTATNLVLNFLEQREATNPCPPGRRRVVAGRRAGECANRRRRMREPARSALSRPRMRARHHHQPGADR